MLSRRVFTGAVGGSLLAARHAVHAQTAGRLARVGVLVSASQPHPFSDAFKRGMSALGYTDGKNVAYEWRYTEGRGDRAAEFAQEFVRLPAEVIVAHLTPAVRAALAATTTIPIVMAPAGAPLQSGFIASLARPGGNVTGLSAMEAEIAGRRLQLLRDLFPNLACVGVLASTPTLDPFSTPFVADIVSAGQRAGVRIVPVLVDGPQDFSSAFETIAKADSQAVIMQPLFAPHRANVIELATKHRIAVMSGLRDVTAAGGLISFAPNFLQLYEQAAEYVDKILKGAKAADLAVQQPTLFRAELNVKTLKSLDLSLSTMLENQIDELIE